MEEKEVKFTETGLLGDFGETGSPGDFGEIEAINFTISEQQVINAAFNESIGYLEDMLELFNNDLNDVDNKCRIMSAQIEIMHRLMIYSDEVLDRQAAEINDINEKVEQHENAIFIMITSAIVLLIVVAFVVGYILINGGI